MRFMDFCAGIGGGRLGLEGAGFECVAFSEIDQHAENTYRTMFSNNTEKNYGDLMTIDAGLLPDFDLLIGGFPCQPFSTMGLRQGLDDTDRGQIIYGIAEIIKERQLNYFILENVKGLTSHDGGRTLKIIINLFSSLGYTLEYKVLNSINFGVPQMRERIYIVGIRDDLINPDIPFKFPEGAKYEYHLSEFLCEDDPSYIVQEQSNPYRTLLRKMGSKYNSGKFSLNDMLRHDYLVIDTRQSDIRIYKNRVPTLRKGRHGILYVRNGMLRNLSGYEALLLQGYPKEYALKVKKTISNNRLLEQAGNGMTINVIRAIADSLNAYTQEATHSSYVYSKPFSYQPSMRV